MKFQLTCKVVVETAYPNALNNAYNGLASTSTQVNKIQYQLSTLDDIGGWRYLGAFPTEGSATDFAKAYKNQYVNKEFEI